MNYATHTPSIRRGRCAARLLCWLLAFPLSAIAQQPGNGNPDTSANETLDLLRQAEDMARQTLPTPAGAAAMPQHAQFAAFAGQQPAKARLYVFVSFSMPPASLHRLATQAASVQVPLVIRGMVGESLGATARRAAEVVHAVPGTSFEIDPAPFSRFGITRVPSFAAATPSATCVNACVPDQAAEVLTGDVTLDYALERLARSDGAAPALARDLLERMRSKP